MGGKNPAFTQVFRANHTPKYLKFMFTTSLPYHAGCQIDVSRNNANCPAKFPFPCFKICSITQSHIPLAPVKKSDKCERRIQDLMI